MQLIDDYINVAIAGQLIPKEVGTQQIIRSEIFKNQT
ncbi:hypothetical protein SDC9_129823 [bioreactor metagenome]|uniref:Uncharacterized protein n=1 Tax=bioreactor metagenome TaxID=1076179 RepID=A0A645D0Y6_9ZZZZ